MFQISPVQTKEVGKKGASSQKRELGSTDYNVIASPRPPLNGIRSAQCIGMISIISASVFADPIEIPNAGFALFHGKTRPENPGENQMI